MAGYACIPVIGSCTRAPTPWPWHYNHEHSPHRDGRNPAGKDTDGRLTPMKGSQPTMTGPRKQGTFTILHDTRCMNPIELSPWFHLTQLNTSQVLFQGRKKIPWQKACSQMRATKNEVSHFREAGDHPAGRANPAYQPSAPGSARHFQDHTLALV